MLLWYCTYKYFRPSTVERSTKPIRGTGNSQTPRSNPRTIERRRRSVTDNDRRDYWIVVLLTRIDLEKLYDTTIPWLLVLLFSLPPSPLTRDILVSNLVSTGSCWNEVLPSFSTTVTIGHGDRTWSRNSRRVFRDHLFSYQTSSVIRSLMLCWTLALPVMKCPVSLVKPAARLAW